MRSGEDMSVANDPAQAHGVSFREAVKVWTRVAALSFGGPAGQIAVMHRILVEEKRWVGENRFLHALNYCMLLPGPEAMQLATYIGWLLHGVRGGLVAGCLFVLPGFIAILALSILYASFQDLSWVQAVFFGIKAAVLAIVIEALLRIDVDDLERRHREELGVEALDVVEVPALGVRVLDRGLDGGIRHELGPAVLGEVADAVASGRQHFPHVRRRVPGTGESCGQSDDGDVVSVRRAA